MISLATVYFLSPFACYEADFVLSQRPSAMVNQLLRPFALFGQGAFSASMKYPFTIVLAVSLLICLFVLASILGVWLKAASSGAPVTFVQLLAMRYLRKVPDRLIVDARIKAAHAGIDLPVEALESHYLAGGNVLETVDSLIIAKSAGLPFSLNEACAMNLSKKGDTELKS